MWVKIDFDFVKEKRGNIFHFWFKTLVFVCLFKKKENGIGEKKTCWVQAHSILIALHQKVHCYFCLPVPPQ
jgi:hypothetical protein